MPRWLLISALCLTLACESPPDGGDAGEGMDAAAPTADAGLDAALFDASDDAAPRDAGPGEVDASILPAELWCEAIGAPVADGFFSLRSYGGALLAGGFGYGREGASLLWSLPPFERVSPGLTGIGESVCALEPFDGYLWANTENSGDIFRSRDGRTWERVHDGPGGFIGCALEVFDGQLFAVSYDFDNRDHGRVLRFAGDRFEVVWDSGTRDVYLRELVGVGGELFAFGVEGGAGRMLRSADGRAWSEEAVAQRYFRAHVIDGLAWIGSASFGSSGGETAIWTFDGRDFTRRAGVPGSHVTGVRRHAGALFATTSNGWKDDPGPSRLLVSRDDGATWNDACVFGETAIWSLEVHDGSLYVATWDFGGRGQVYRLRTDPRPADGCAALEARAGFELCEREASRCAGVFTDSAGCASHCAAAGLRCVASFGGEPGCQVERDNPLACDPPSGNMSDWCECAP